VRSGIVLLLAAVCAVSAPVSKTDSALTPLWNYAGTWQVTRNGTPDAKPDELNNQCTAVGKYFVCQQAVNGQPGSLLVVIPTSKPGHYYTQNVTPEGRATSRGDLEINGRQWEFRSTWDEGGRTTYYRTTNVFTGGNRIHFEQAESSNGKDWTVKSSGDEVRSSSRAH
jgi:hypothetical protein